MAVIDRVPERSRSCATSTEAVHAGENRARPDHALTCGVAQTATYTFNDTADLERYMRGDDGEPNRTEYGRYDNPTVRELERRLAALERSEDSVAFSSGMAAVGMVLFTFLKAGDHVVLFRDCYRKTRQLVTSTLSRFAVEHSIVPPGDLEALQRELRNNTRLILSESPSNPYLYCVDLDRLARVARAHGRARIVVDSTFATPVNLRPIEHGADLVLHSATKYLAGHNDVLGGIVAGSGALISLLRDMRGAFGSILDPHAAYLIGRGLKTLSLRVERQNQTAAALAEVLAGHPKVARVFYPSLADHPSRKVALEQMTGFGGVVSFEVRGDRAAASRVVDACRLAQIAPSLGGVESLVEQPAIMSYFELDDESLQSIDMSSSLIRLAVGIEETEDVISDVTRALEQA